MNYNALVKLFTAQAEWCGFRVKGIPVDAIISVLPPPEWPDNHRAILMGELWESVRTYNESGIFWLAPDVALDPDDLAAMTAAVEHAPADVHTGLVKLWPESTGRQDWMWSHRGGTLGQPAATQDETAPVAYFSMDCVWTPGRLLDLAASAILACAWFEVDVRWSELAIEHGIAAHTVPGCRPKHLHFSREHDGRQRQSDYLRRNGPAVAPGQGE